MPNLLLIGAVVAGVAGSASCGVLSHWRFDEPSGTTAHDSVGDVDGQLSGDAMFQPGLGVSGGAIEFPIGMNGLVSMGDAYPFSAGESFTLSAWIRTADMQTSQARFAVGRHFGGFVNGYFLSVNQSGGYGAPGITYLYAGHGPGGEARSDTIVTDAQWRHLVGVYESGIPTIYVDGAPAEGVGAASTVSDGGANFLIGGLTTSSGLVPLFEGLIDDVQVYDIALTPYEVQRLFDNPGDTVCRGDVDDDRSVSFNDLNIILENWAMSATPGEDGDLDHSGTVDFNDLNIVLDNWGQQCPSAS